MVVLVQFYLNCTNHCQFGLLRVDFIMKGGGMAGRHVSYFGSEGGSILCERWMESLDPKVVAY